MGLSLSLGLSLTSATLNKGAGAIGTKSRTGRRVPFGMMLPQVTGNAGYSWHTAMTVSGAFDQVRVLFGNTTGNAVPIDRLIIACSDSIASSTPLLVPTGSGAAWVDGTFDGGSLSGLMPANTRGSDKASVPQYYKSDWINLNSIPRTDGGRWPVLLARVYLSTSLAIPMAGTGAFTGSGWRSEATDRQLYAAWSKSGDFVSSNRAGFTGLTEPGTCPIIGFEYRNTVAGVTIAVFGDSISGGEKATLTYNPWGVRAGVLQDTPSLPVNVENFGWGGQTLALYYARWQEYLASGFRPSIAVWAVSTPNGFSGVQGQIDLATSYANQFIADCRAYGITGIINSQAPRDSYDLASDNVRKACSAAGAAIAAASGGFINLDPAWSDGASPAKFISGLSTDFIHPNEAGNVAGVSPASVQMAAAIGSLRG